MASIIGSWSRISQLENTMVAVSPAVMVPLASASSKLLLTDPVLQVGRSLSNTCNGVNPNQPWMMSEGSTRPDSIDWAKLYCTAARVRGNSLSPQDTTTSSMATRSPSLASAVSSVVPDPTEGAIQVVAPPVCVVNEPALAIHRMSTFWESGSVAVAVRLIAPPAGTEAASAVMEMAGWRLSRPV